MKYGFFTLFLCSLLVLPSVGCKGSIDTNSVEGTVTWDGRPVAGAQVSFQPQGATGALAVGRTDEQGKYALTTSAGEYGAGTVVGRYKVLVTKIPSGARGRPAATTELPGTYAEIGSTPLEFEVKAGRNTFDITLEGSAAAKPRAK